MSHTHTHTVISISSEDCLIFDAASDFVVVVIVVALFVFRWGWLVFQPRRLRREQQTDRLSVCRVWQSAIQMEQRETKGTSAEPRHLLHLLFLLITLILFSVILFSDSFLWFFSLISFLPSSWPAKSVLFNFSVLLFPRSNPTRSSPHHSRRRLPPFILPTVLSSPLPAWTEHFSSTHPPHTFFHFDFGFIPSFFLFSLVFNSTPSSLIPLPDHQVHLSSCSRAQRKSASCLLLSIHFFFLWKNHNTAKIRFSWCFINGIFQHYVGAKCYMLETVFLSPCSSPPSAPTTSFLKSVFLLSWWGPEVFQRLWIYFLQLHSFSLTFAIKHFF